ncbi:fibrobacter succinogenes major paralogous domain-containing protein [Bacteroidota bacterium]
MKMILSILLISLFITTACTEEGNNPTEIVDDLTVDYEGKTYNVVQIGNQFWLKENLDIGTMIRGIDAPANNGIIEKYYYDNDSSYSDNYGGLYTWDEAMQYSMTEGAQGICPSGWHIPTHADLEELQAAVNNNSNALKAIGEGSGNGAGTNSSGFSLFLAGYHTPETGGTNVAGQYTVLWSSTQFNSLRAYRLSVTDYDSIFSLYITNKDIGYSVRCVKD